ncbi:MAG: hypothetical protein K2U26_14505, partial [Cyclobacteriaceae bacterium]|nr:hypothetical protein [Cyclobacteriaceae bacterium]
MKKIILFISVIAALSINDLRAQSSENGQYLPPSPNAAALMRFSAIPVNYYTGVADISVPLFDLKGRDITVPIGLNYHASGIKVQDVASSVGIGWALNAGGAITRVVRSKPDGSPGGICTQSTGLGLNCDYEADIFYYSFLGRGGQIYLNANGAPFTMPYQDFVISPGVGAQSIGYW